MNWLLYLILRFFIGLFRFAPFSALYWFSDLICLFLHYITAYRKKVVLQNLQNSLPDTGRAEIQRIVAGFYHHLADNLIEGIKAFSMSEDALGKRYRIVPSRFLEEQYRKGQSVICVAGHYNNWEWGGTAAGKQIKHRPVGLYKPLTNKYIDKYVRNNRTRGRTVLASITQTAETFRTDWGEPALFFMVADQSPINTHKAIWVNFLNQVTAVLHGPEKYARLYNMPVVYAEVTKVKRGYYSLEVKVLVEDPSRLKPGDITSLFMATLEEQIRKNPEFYLWSHRRWKLKPSENQTSVLKP